MNVFSDKSIDRLMKQFGTMIILKTFPYAKFPSYVENLKEYRWKPLIIALELQLNPVVFWLDAHVEVERELSLLTRHFKSCISIQTCSFYPWMLFGRVSHSIYAATNEKVGSTC